MTSCVEPIPVRNPRTGVTDYSIHPPSADQLHAISERIRAAQPRWDAAGVDYRARIIRRWADAMEGRRAELIRAEQTDTGRTRIATAMVDATIANIRTWADRAPSLISAARREGFSTVWPNVRYESQLRPYPLVGAIAPWNQPIFLSTVDAIPALLAGCGVIVKPSEYAPRFAAPLMDAVRDVPELAEVLQFIDGAGETGRELVEQVDAICFTGSVPTGRKVAEAAARRFIPAFLELGGKDAVIVTASADLERAVQATLRGGVYATGQVCHAIERVYVQRDLYSPFVDRLVEAANSITLNLDDEPGHVGPFIMEKQAVIADAHLDDAVRKGARILTGGKSEIHNGGIYIRPTVVVDVDHNMALMKEETFAPIIPVMPYDTEREAIELANDSEFGLSGAVLAGDVDEAKRIGEQIDAGGISLQDTTLTSAIISDAEKSSFRYSGLGESRMGPSAILRYFRRKALMTNTTEPVFMSSWVESAAETAGGAR